MLRVTKLQWDFKTSAPGGLPTDGEALQDSSWVGGSWEGVRETGVWEGSFHPGVRRPHHDFGIQTPPL